LNRNSGKPDLKSKYKAGMQGQQEAEDFLLTSGYLVLKRNYRTRTGEIDLIAQHRDYIVFIEVKFRSGLKFGYPREAVGRLKQQRIVRTALHYISTNQLINHNFRFDVIEVFVQSGQIQVNHIENAFGA